MVLGKIASLQNSTNNNETIFPVFFFNLLHVCALLLHVPVRNKETVCALYTHLC